MTATETLIPPSIFAGVEMRGGINVDDATLAAQVAASIRRGHPQVWMTPPKPDRIALVGSGPSLASTERELVELLHAGAKLVTVNGAYRWALERNLKPAAQIVIDARPTNARFLEPAVPGCRYYVASQCHPSTWDVVQGRAHVGIFHAVTPDGDGPLKALLDAYYLGHWQGVVGGTTVTTRALALLRLLGYLRFDFFGIDSCWLGEAHHAFAQPENDRDDRIRVTVSSSEAPERRKTFVTSPWMLKQADDLFQMIRACGDEFLIRVHGEGLIAWMFSACADVLSVEGE